MSRLVRFGRGTRRNLSKEYKTKMVSNRPTISIVTVCFNCVDMIEKTIVSVIEQTYENIEYIVIDGASTDGTLDVINKYKDSITKVVSEPDKGIYDAMNKGISLATGKWIHFRNSGDFFLRKDSVEQFFTQPIADDVSIVHGNCLYYDENGWFEKTPPCLIRSYKDEIPVLHPATFVRTDLQKQMPFDLQYRSSADYDFFFKCCEKGVKMEYRPIAIVAFARGGFSSNWERAFWEDCRLKGLDKTLAGKTKAYYRFYYIKLFKFYQGIKKKSGCLRKFSLHREKNGSLQRVLHSFPLPSDF